LLRGKKIVILKKADKEARLMKGKKKFKSLTALVAAAALVISCGSSGKTRRGPEIPFPEGSFWKYTDPYETRYQKFFAGGGLLLIDDISNDNSWYQDGPTIYFSINSGYVEYEGEWADSQTIRGSARDLMGETWDFEMTLETDPVLLEEYSHYEIWESGSVFPPFDWPLRGANEIRIRNPNAFSLLIAIRGDSGSAEGGGVDFNVPPSSFNSVFIPDGSYSIYFVFSYQPEILYKGDGFYLSEYGFEIEIAQPADGSGNYGIHRVN
jgi:hypothetical protein